MVRLLCILTPDPAKVYNDDNNRWRQGWIVDLFDDGHIFTPNEVPPRFTIVDVNLNKNQTAKFVAPLMEEQLEPNGELGLNQTWRKTWYISRADLTNPQQTGFDTGQVTISPQRLGQCLRHVVDDHLAKDDPSVWPP